MENYTSSQCLNCGKDISAIRYFNPSKIYCSKKCEEQGKGYADFWDVFNKMFGQTN